MEYGFGDPVGRKVIARVDPPAWMERPKCGENSRTLIPLPVVCIKFRELRTRDFSARAI